VPGAQTVTSKVWQDGEYICSLPTEEWPQPVAALDVTESAAERRVNRAAQWLMTAGGLFFWLALMAVALAASLGWRLAFL
jgi:hypothetical protein